MVLPRGPMGLSAVCDSGVPDHTHLLFMCKFESFHMNGCNNIWHARKFPRVHDNCQFYKEHISVSH